MKKEVPALERSADGVYADPTKGALWHLWHPTKVVLSSQPNAGGVVGFILAIANIPPRADKLEQFLPQVNNELRVPLEQ